MDFTARYESPLGPMLLASNGLALTGLWFIGQRYFDAALLMQKEAGGVNALEKTKQWLSAYFAGEDPGYTPELLFRGTPFQTAVWEALLAVPYGKTSTYAAMAEVLARKLGREKPPVRAVANAIGRNPISVIVPCHRVIGTDGTLKGYAGGLERKARLLALEGAQLPGRTVRK